ncbi:MAG: hypothetical protein AAFW89_06090 [Bacteroidota bacterium]
MNKLRFLLILPVIGMVYSSVHARQVNADRAGATYSSFTADAQQLMIESGVLLNTDASDIGALTLRFGLSEHLEVQAWAGSILISDAETRWSNKGIGVKYALGSLLNGRAHVGILGITQTPVFGEGSETTSELLLLNDIGFNSAWSLSTNLSFGGSWEHDGASGFSFSTIPTYALTREWAVFGGYTHQWRENQNDFIEGGATFLVTPSFQIDAAFVYDDLLTLGFGIVAAF